MTDFTQLDTGIFKCRHSIALITSEAAFSKYVRRRYDGLEDIEFLPGGCLACVQEVKANEPVVGDGPRRMLFVCIDKESVRRERRTPYGVLSTLMHEAVHCWQKILLYIEEDKPGTEIEAYSISNICEQLFRAYGGLVKEDSKMAKKSKGKKKGCK